MPNCCCRAADDATAVADAMDVVEYGRAWYWLMMDLARGTNPILAPLPPRKPRPHSPIGLTVVELEISHH